MPSYLNIYPGRQRTYRNSYQVSPNFLNPQQADTLFASKEELLEFLDTKKVYSSWPNFLRNVIKFFDVRGFESRSDFFRFLVVGIILLLIFAYGIGIFLFFVESFYSPAKRQVVEAYLFGNMGGITGFTIKNIWNSIAIFIAFSILTGIVRRLHDANYSGWWCLALVFLPVIGLVAVLLFCSQPSNYNNNKYVYKSYLRWKSSKHYQKDQDSQRQEHNLLC